MSSWQRRCLSRLLKWRELFNYPKLLILRHNLNPTALARIDAGNILRSISEETRNRHRASAIINFLSYKNKTFLFARAARGQGGGGGQGEPPGPGKLVNWPRTQLRATLSWFISFIILYYVKAGVGAGGDIKNTRGDRRKYFLSGTVWMGNFVCVQTIDRLKLKGALQL